MGLGAALLSLCIVGGGADKGRMVPGFGAASVVGAGAPGCFRRVLPAELGPH